MKFSRRHLRSLNAIAVLVLAGSASIAQEAPPEAEQGASAAAHLRLPPKTWFAQALARSQSGLNVTYFWSKGHMMRAETVVAGHKIVTIVRGDRYYAYDELNRQGVAVRRMREALALDHSQRRPFGNELEILQDQGAEKVYSKELMGRMCDVYRITDDRGRRELWVTQDELALPLRMEVFERGTSRKLFTDYINWQSGFSMSDDFFEPDDRIEFKEYETEEYFRVASGDGDKGPVPILYMDLLRGHRRSR
ncbi:hypothetical protein MK489_15235 [Myxococcota bacterium]|nr:hypothetical protein [Myxococcota bacterium]